MHVLKLALVAWSLCLIACATPLGVRAPILYPARVPVRAYPTVWLVGAPLREGDLVERLRAHLARTPDLSVRRIEVAELEPLREAGTIPPLSLVVTVEAEIGSDVREEWDVVPVQYCAFGAGCFTDFQPVQSAVREVTGEAMVTVYDGPSARVLQTERFRAHSYASDERGVRSRVFEQLAWELERAVDLIRTEHRFELEQVTELPDVGAALTRIQKGDWAEGQRLLERAVQNLPGELSRRTQARVWYNLAVARWHGPGPGQLSRGAYEQARQALELAIALDGSSRYLPTLSRLEQARSRQATLEQQRQAAAHNFALRAATPASP